MSKNVFANGKEVSGKKDDNKSIAAMADTCLSPPSPPAGPVPLPYPNTAEAADTSDGSKTVKIGGDEVGLKNSSNYKKSTGDEAATKSLGMGVVSHNIQGKMKHAAWSMDVKFEGQNAIRHMDMTTHNHMNADNVALTCDQAKDKAEQGKDLTCEELENANKDARNNELDKGVMKEKEGFALTTAYRKNGGSEFLKAVSDQDAPLKEKKSGYKDPVDQKMPPECARQKVKKGKKKGKVKRYSRRKSDSETKILDPVMRAGGGGSIKMKIFHQSNTGVKDSMPCWSCRDSICGAEKCGIKVILCNNKNEEVEAKDLCGKDGEPEPVGGTQQEKESLWAGQGFV